MRIQGALSNLGQSILQFRQKSRGDATPARMPEGSGSSENLLEAMEMMRLWVLAFSALEWPSYPRTSHRPQGYESNPIEESIPAMMQSAERKCNG